MVEGDVGEMLVILVGFGVVLGVWGLLDLFNWAQLGHTINTISTPKPVWGDRRVGGDLGLGRS